MNLSERNKRPSNSGESCCDRVVLRFKWDGTLEWWTVTSRIRKGLGWRGGKLGPARVPLHSHPKQSFAFLLSPCPLLVFEVCFLTVACGRRAGEGQRPLRCHVPIEGQLDRAWRCWHLSFRMWTWAWCLLALSNWSQSASLPSFPLAPSPDRVFTLYPKLVELPSSAFGVWPYQLALLRFCL